MLVSSTSMNVASVTVSAINHGFMAGATYSWRAGIADTASLISPRLSVPQTFPAAANDRCSGPDRARS